MLLISYGTRPEWLKIKPIIDEFKNRNLSNYKILYTGQHADLVEKNYDIITTINDGKNRLDSIVSSLLNKEELFESITHVMVQGDTCSAFSIALAAFHRNIKVIHLEAGLRTYDSQNPYPEEFYRQSIGNLADLHLSPTNLNKENLLKEGKTNIYVVGNTSIDNLKNYKNSSYTKNVLITLHRRENHGMLKDWYEEISRCANILKDWKFTVISHPNPNVQNNLKYLKDVDIIPPIKHDDMLKRISSCGFLISDSGGLQEEASYFKKKIIVCRKVTERQETLENTSFLCKHPNELYNMTMNISKNYQVQDFNCPYGDGDCAKKVTDILISTGIL